MTLTSRGIGNETVPTGAAATGAGATDAAAAPLATAGAAGSGADAVGVSLRRLRRVFGDVAALDDLTLEIAPGELVALLGPSGCGKTTALRALAGFEIPDAGSIVVGGIDMTAVPANKRDMGMVFQAYSLFPNLTAVDNVAFGLRLRKVPAARRRARAAELLELVGLGDKGKRYTHELSGGQQQRVALARALAIEPRVLLLDEPLSALDAQVRLALRDEIRALQTRLGITTLFVTHDQEEALSIADRVGVMRAGRLEQVAPPEEVYAWPATPFVAEFVGTINRIPGRLLGDRTVEVLGQRLPVVDVGGAAGSSDGGDVPAQRSVGEVDVLVRPEAVAVVPTTDGPAEASGSGVSAPGASGSGASDAGASGARVTRRTFLGPITRVSVLLPDGRALIADMVTADAGTLPVGARVTVRLAVRPVLVADPR
jgi:putative spermidine/putrescine transport system ATP-binding protein